MSLEEIRDVRRKKLEIIRNFGMDPYPAKVPRDMSLSIVRKDFESIKNEVSLAGRIVAIREAGAITFMVFQDGSDRFQAVFKKDSIEDEKKFTLFHDAVDIGDFISVTGTLFKTGRGEESILVKDWTIASKALLPLPEKWHGIQDDDERRRKRYLETISDKDVYERFVLRAKIIKGIREYMENKLDFMEVETPILQNEAGGAMARVFDTHHNDFDIDLVLRISLEIEHKMIMAGGYPRIYEIGKNFRNEGSDPTHIQEFTMMEWYAAFATLEDNIQWTEDLLKHLAKDIVGKTIFTVYDNVGNGIEVDFSKAWPKKKFSDLLKEYAEIDMGKVDDNALKEKALSLGMGKDELSKVGRGSLLEFIFKRTTRPKLINPTFVTDYPGELKPLAQQNEDGTARVAQLIIGGAEITNQYAELIDPIQQRKLLEMQVMAKEAGDEEAMGLNMNFITAMEHGMPPMTGHGIGIDRLIAIFTNQKNLRDVIFFPIMKPKEI